MLSVLYIYQYCVYRKKGQRGQCGKVSVYCLRGLLLVFRVECVAMLRLCKEQLVSAVWQV